MFLSRLSLPPVLSAVFRNSYVIPRLSKVFLRFPLLSPVKKQESSQSLTKTSWGKCPWLSVSKEHSSRNMWSIVTSLNFVCGFCLKGLLDCITDLKPLIEILCVLNPSKLFSFIAALSLAKSWIPGWFKFLRSPEVTRWFFRTIQGNASKSWKFGCSNIPHRTTRYAIKIIWRLATRGNCGYLGKRKTLRKLYTRVCP